MDLTGAKADCENGDCGSCSVLVNGWPVKSCLILTAEAIGKKITTVEGLKNAPIPKAFVEEFAYQCGYCISGFLLVCHALKNIHPNAPDIVIDEWLQSNICRCTGYEEIGKAARTILFGAHEESSKTQDNIMQILLKYVILLSFFTCFILNINLLFFLLFFSVDKYSMAGHDFFME